MALFLHRPSGRLLVSILVHRWLSLLRDTISTENLKTSESAKKTFTSERKHSTLPTYCFLECPTNRNFCVLSIYPKSLHLKALYSETGNSLHHTLNFHICVASLPPLGLMSKGFSISLLIVTPSKTPNSLAPSIASSASEWLSIQHTGRLCSRQRNACYHVL